METRDIVRYFLFRRSAESVDDSNVSRISVFARIASDAPNRVFMSATPERVESTSRLVAFIFAREFCLFGVQSLGNITATVCVQRFCILSDGTYFI